MNYCDDLLNNFQIEGNRRAVFELESGREISWRALAVGVRNLAAALFQRGVSAGASVAIHLFNSIDAALLHLAVQYLGARSCFIDALVQPDALDFYVAITGSRLLVTHLSPSRIRLEDSQQDVDILTADRIASLASSSAACSIAPPGPYDWDPDEVCYVYFTSGTTSRPKGVMLTGRNHRSFTRICDAYWRPVSPSSKHLCFVPFSHGFGTIFLLPLALRTRSELYIMRAFHPLRVADAVTQHGMTHLYGVPSHYRQLLRLPEAQERLRGLEMAFCAAAKLEHRLMLDWEAATGTVLSEGYGLIETCCGIVWRVNTPSLGTGHMGPLPDPALLALRILDADFRPLPPGESGQIAVRGPSVMKGYLSDTEETDRVLRDGWFLTGDKGYLTEDNHLFMTGRLKDIINIAGIKVSPYEVEAVLHQHPGVAEAAVVAAPDALYGEVVKAYVRPKTDMNPTERELIQFASTKLINFQVPKRIDFVERFPLNTMGKLDRNALRALNPV